MPTDEMAAPRPPAQVPPPLVPGLRGLLTLAVGVVLIAALYFGREVFIPLVLAVLLSFVLAPVVNLLRWIKLGRVPSVIVAVLLALAVIGGIGALIGTQVAGLAGNLPQYQATVQKKFAGLQEGWLGEANRIIAKFSHQVHDATQKADAAGTTAATGPAGDTPKAQLVRVQEPRDLAAGAGREGAWPDLRAADHGRHRLRRGGVPALAAGGPAQPHDPPVRVGRPAPHDRRHGRCREPPRHLFLAQLGMNAAFGVIIGVGLWFIGVPNPLLWGVFSALMRFVPYIGASISGAVPAGPGGRGRSGLDDGHRDGRPVPGGRAIFGQVIEPLLYGHSTGLSPFAVIVSTLFWLALGPHRPDPAPRRSRCLVVLGRHVDSLEFLDILLGDRPPLTPVENFYQRMLAGDPDEVRDLAETMLKERSLSVVLRRGGA